MLTFYGQQFVLAKLAIFLSVLYERTEHRVRDRVGVLRPGAPSWRLPGAKGQAGRQGLVRGRRSRAELALGHPRVAHLGDREGEGRLLRVRGVRVLHQQGFTLQTH